MRGVQFLWEQATGCQQGSRLREGSPRARTAGRSRRRRPPSASWCTTRRSGDPRARSTSMRTGVLLPRHVAHVIREPRRRQNDGTTRQPRVGWVARCEGPHIALSRAVWPEVPTREHDHSTWRPPRAACRPRRSRSWPPWASPCSHPSAGRPSPASPAAASSCRSWEPRAWDCRALPLPLALRGTAHSQLQPRCVLAVVVPCRGVRALRQRRAVRPVQPDVLLAPASPFPLS